MKISNFARAWCVVATIAAIEVPLIAVAGENSVPPKLGVRDTRPTHDLSGSWALRIENAKRQPITTLTIQFADETATSCLSGDWKRVAVSAHKSLDEAFFPATEPLSYKINDDILVIG